MLVYPKVQGIGLYRGRIKQNGYSHFAIVKIEFAKQPIAPSKKNIHLIEIKKNGVLTLDGACTIKCGYSICVYKSNSLDIGKIFYANMNTKILCKQKLRIGKHCRLGWDVQIYDSNFHFIYNEESKNISRCHDDIFIYDNIWKTNQCTISKGAVIPAFSKATSGSFICKNFSNVATKGNVFAGRSAKLLKTGSFRIMNTKNEFLFLDYFDKNSSAQFYNIDEFKTSTFEN